MNNSKVLVYTHRGSTGKKPLIPACSFEEATRRAEDLLSQMTLEERISMIGGSNSFYTTGIPRLGIPALYLSDATQGVHIRHELPGQMEKSTAFPSPVCLAASWNTDLAYAYAEAIGEECRAGDIAILLGPGMNIYRIAQNGRSFEYFGEDPFLVSRMIESYVKGMQSTGTIATLKHFLGNNTEYYRRWSNSVMDERAIHEIYTPAFKAGIDAGALALMCSYNQINGEYSAENRPVITGLLREQFGFKWLVMSDWWSIWNPAKAIASGLDLDMPGHTHENFLNDPRIGDVSLKNNAPALLAAGLVSESQINRMVLSILRTIVAAGLLDRPVKDVKFLERFDAHGEIALQCAREGIVLLTNRNAALPLENCGTVMLLGDQIKGIAGGNGAAAVEGFDTVSLRESLTAQFGQALFIGSIDDDEAISSAGAILYHCATCDSEAWDHPFNLPVDTQKNILRCCELNPRTIVIVSAGSGRDMSAWADKAAAIIYNWYPGQYGNIALTEILSGRSNPSGKLPITIERSFTDSPGFGYIPEGEELYSDWPNDMNKSRENYDIIYKEGIFVGYRWYEKRRIAPLFAFGHGLSYTGFTMSDLRLSDTIIGRNQLLTIHFRITNTSSRPGAETAQLYICDCKASVDRPHKELKGFTKTGLEPGQSRELTFTIGGQDLSFWDTARKSWITEPGEFRILIGNSSDNIILEQSFILR